MAEDCISDNDLTAPNAAERWQFDCASRIRELELREEVQRQLSKEQSFARWWNPLFVAVVAAGIAAGVNVYATWSNGNQQIKLAAQVAESARILEMLHAPTTEKAIENLKFLLDAGLVTNPTTEKSLRDFLSRHRNLGDGPLLSPDWVDQDTKHYLYNYGSYKNPSVETFSTTPLTK